MNDQEKQIVLLLDKCIPSGQAWLMILQIDELPYIELTETPLCRASLLNVCLSMVSGNLVVLIESTVGWDFSVVFLSSFAGCDC